MARAGRKDRGLLSKPDSTGKPLWYVRLYHDGKERRFGSFRTKTEARDFYEKAKQEQQAGRFFPERYQHGGYDLIQDTVDRYLLTIATKRNQRMERGYAAWWCERWQGLRLNAITPEALDRARRDLLEHPRESKKCRTPQTVNRYCAWLRHVLNQAVRDGKLASNPVLKLKMYAEPKGKTRFLSMEEEALLLEKLGPTYGPWARLAILTGLRQGEQFRLQWKDVDLDRGILTLPATKAGGVQYAHMNEEAKAILRGFNSWQRSKWVFPSRNPATPLDARNFYTHVWGPAVRDAGIERATWHDLRHTFASRLAMNGQNEGTIASLLRHSTTALVKRYAHLSPSHLKAAVEGVAGFGKAPTGSRESQGVSNGTVTGTGNGESVKVGDGG